MGAPLGALVLSAGVAWGEPALDPPAPGGSDDQDSVPASQGVSLSAAGGWDLPSRQPWAGLDLAMRHEGVRGWAFHGGLEAGWGLLASRPHAKVEAGFMGVVPSPRLLRVGAVAGAQVLVAPGEVPLSLGGDADGYGEVALLPYGYGQIELGWNRLGATKGAAMWSFGLRLGAAAAPGGVACGPEGTDVCSGVTAAFLGGITARVRFHEGVFLEGLAGPTARLSVGYAFRPSKRRLAASRWEAPEVRGGARDQGSESDEGERQGDLYEDFLRSPRR